MSCALVWFRRDLRNFEHAALHAALKAHRKVHCAFVFDREILDSLPRQDRRVEFIWESVRELKTSLETAGGGFTSSTETRATRSRSSPRASKFPPYSPTGTTNRGDRGIAKSDALLPRGHRFPLAKDHAIFERDEVLTGRPPLSVFTPYKTHG